MIRPACRLGVFVAACALASTLQAATPVVAELGVHAEPNAASLAYTDRIRLVDVLQREAEARALEVAARPDAGYQKQTEFDNTPYRFNMKPGEKMNAEQFDAWMASRGIRIVPAKAAAEPAPAVVAN